MTLLDIARQAVAAGLSVVPPRMDGSKAPVGEWKQYQHRRPTDDELRRWYGAHTGIGVVCGQISGGLELLEFEGRAVADGTYAHFLAAINAAGLEDVFQRIQGAYMETSPTGGIHLLYRCDKVDGSKKLARRKTADGVEVLIETKGEGGYVITAPTDGKVHPSGRPWIVVRGELADVATITPDEREQLHRVARTFDTYQPEDAPRERQAVAPTDSDRPGDVYNSSPQAVDEILGLLEQKGWKRVYTRDQTHYLRRPGKDEGISATLGAKETGGGFYVFSTSTEFDSERRYGLFSVYAMLAHSGDFAAASSELNRRGVNASGEPWYESSVVIPDKAVPTATEGQSEIAGIRFLNLKEVLTGDFADEQWLVEPVLPKGRQIAIYAQGKTGKSLFVLDMCAALASGRRLLGRETQKPIHVLYVDFEMTPSDLQERLADLGYNPTDPDFHILQEHLHYAMLQPFHAFDTPEGGLQLEEVVAACGAELVVIDTLIRSVRGEENSSDTVKDFNRYTGIRLKAKGVTLVRVDHAGKDTAKGQRGTSAKRDDVDVVWRLRADAAVNGVENLRLINDASRMSWVPQEVPIKRRLDPLRHELPAEQIGEQAATAWWHLKRAGAASDITVREAGELVRNAGWKGADKHVSEAVRWWKRGVDIPATRPATSSQQDSATNAATETENPPQTQNPWSGA